MFAIGSGVGLARVNLESLAPGTHVVTNIIDSWATMLNYEEHKRDPDKPYRLFCKTSTMVMFLCNMHIYISQVLD